jgi:molybdopterin-guanine dinucleotide biosynthesis protein
MGHIVARVKKARINYRSFAPSENSRLAAMEAIIHVANSFGVLIPLLPDGIKDSEIHNIRGAFIAGLAHGMRKPTTILQSGGDPVPLDVRDFAKSWAHPRDIDDYIETLAGEVLESLQSSDELVLPTRGLLTSMSIGDPMAENEFQTLGSYFVETDQYLRTLRGDVNLVVGRKGTGKTALFSQVRDRLRRDRQNIVVDLKPEGYQLRKLKDDVFGFLTQGAREHLVVAFWEYLLYLEVGYKILEKDKDRHHRDHRLTEPYRRLSAAYYSESGDSTGDFSERLHELSDRISRQYLTTHGTGVAVHLSTGEVTALIHRQDLHALSQQIAEYLALKHDTWVLFDNLDRGWSPSGLSSDDILIVRSLIDAGRKILRDMQRSGRAFHCVIFLRNDVYQLLMHETSDFGKEMRTSLDWNDRDLLRELLRSRLAANDQIPNDVSFDRVWGEICVPLIDGTESSEYLIERSLMRPRNLLKQIIHCRGSAINLRHEKILEEDIRKGLASYSTDLLIEIDQEITQIDSRAAGLLYVFANERAECSRDDLEVPFDIKKIPSYQIDRIIDFLLYYGFLGVKVVGADPKYIHDVNYDMRMIKTTIEKYAKAICYVINPAFWPALSITE